MRPTRTMIVLCDSNWAQLNYDYVMSTAFIFVDNLRIGGFQRLALDQAYGLSDQGVDCTIITLEEPTDQALGNRYLSSIESALMEEKGIQVRKLSNDRFQLYRQLRVLLKQADVPLLIISHSLRSTFILKLIKLTSPGLQLRINTKIHQIPSLVDRNQRFKRFIYAQFSDYLFCFSEAVRVTWVKQFGRSFLGLTTLSRKISLLRNGIYIPRLPEMCVRSKADISQPRLIFLGRLTFWKGLEILERLASERELSDFNFLFIIPFYDEMSMRAISEILGDRLEVITGKSVGELEIYPGDIHLYPTQYGNKSTTTESISLNCLEMAGIGIPSIVTIGGQHTWTEPLFNEVFLEVDWRNMDQVLMQIAKAADFRMTPEFHGRLAQLISIDNELKSYKIS